MAIASRQLAAAFGNLIVEVIKGSTERRSHTRRMSWIDENQLPPAFNRGRSCVISVDNLSVKYAVPSRLEK